MSDLEVRQWLEKALHDYKTAEKLLETPDEEMITDTLCFHCEQFVEKVLKAFLVSNHIDFRRTHNLEYLVKLCSELDSEFAWIDEVAERLTEYAVEIRYPDEFYQPTAQEARAAFQLAAKVKQFIFGKLGIA